MKLHIRRAQHAKRDNPLRNIITVKRIPGTVIWGDAGRAAKKIKRNRTKNGK